MLVLLSGGRDSVCLLHLAVEVAGRDAVRALHVNYGLRAAADADAAFCARLCRGLGVALAVRHPWERGKRPAGNLQALARQERYAAARELAQGEDIAVGHTATDQVETILYRLASSPSRRALLGMRSRDGALVRPLLSYTREETAAYCRAAGLEWREDETNAAIGFVRGRIRHVLVPALRSIHPAAEANVLALSEILRDEADVLDGLVADALAGSDSVSLRWLREHPPAIARLIVQRLADAAVGRPAPGTARRLDEILALREQGALDLPHRVRATVRQGELRFEPQPSPHSR